MFCLSPHALLLHAQSIGHDDWDENDEHSLPLAGQSLLSDIGPSLSVLHLWYLTCRPFLSQGVGDHGSHSDEGGAGGAGGAGGDGGVGCPGGAGGVTQSGQSLVLSVHAETRFASSSQLSFVVPV